MVYVERRPPRYYEAMSCDDIEMSELLSWFGCRGEPTQADELNWLFLSTSGVHGSYGKLDEVDEHRRELVADGFDEPPTITFLALQPRTVRSRYGNVIVRTKEDEATLRRLVLETLAAVAASQTGNT